MTVSRRPPPIEYNMTATIIPGYGILVKVGKSASSTSPAKHAACAMAAHFLSPILTEYFIEKRSINICVTKLTVIKSASLDGLIPYVSLKNTKYRGARFIIIACVKNPV